MKIPVFLTLACAAISAWAEDGLTTVKATTRILADGSRATTVTDPDKGTAIETVEDSAGKMLRKTLYSLDATGNTTGAVRYDSKGNIRYKESYKRDGAGRISDTYLYSKDDKLLGRRSFVYDAKGNPMQVDDYDAKGNLLPKAQPSGSSGPKKRRR
jgi:hypothetical protein